MTIGQRIKSIREKNGLSQRALADLVHISSSFLSRIETGSSTPNIDTICAIASALNCTPQDILCDIFTYGDNMSIVDKAQILMAKLTPKDQIILCELLELYLAHMNV